MRHVNERWLSIIVPAKGISLSPLWELWGYGFLVETLVKRNLKSHYFQTIFGPLWLIAQPLFTSLIFITIFTKIIRIPTDGSSSFVFYFGGIVLWGFFSRCVNSLSNTFSMNSYLFNKLYFPRIVIPVADVITHVIQFTIQYVFLLAISLYYSLHSGGPAVTFQAIMVTILAVVLTALTGSGIGLLCASTAITFRDVKYLVSYGMQMLFYATPIIYPSSKVPHSLRFFLTLNPVASAIELFRYPFSGVLSLSVSQIVISCILSLALFMLGTGAFLISEKTCVDRL